jgi:hypothetical protein
MAKKTTEVTRRSTWDRGKCFSIVRVAEAETFFAVTVAPVCDELSKKVLLYFDGRRESYRWPSLAMTH